MSEGLVSGGAVSGAARRVLLLGGTAEARALAARLVDDGIEVTSSLAGRVSRPRLPVGEVRIGGFGGVDGLVAALRDGGVTHLVDATHPFAATMTAHAAAAAERAGVPVLRLARPGWRERPDAASWSWVGDVDAARERAETLGGRPFVTTGRQSLGRYAGWTDRPVLVRVVEPLTEPVPAGWSVLEARGPYDVTGERELMTRHRVDVLLTKDSGGSYTAAKLDAAAELGVPVVVVSRPSPPAGLREVPDVAAVLAWLDQT
ncbi:cobalt-precorrin-6A reductase [Janibacter alkaliphilus]